MMFVCLNHHNIMPISDVYDLLNLTCYLIDIMRATYSPMYSQLYRYIHEKTAD